MSAVDDRATRELVGRVDTLVGELEEKQDWAALEAIRALLDLYGEALERVMAGADGTRDALVADEVVGHLLLVHGLHPDDIETRVTRALEPHAGAELVSAADGVVRVQLASGCGSSSRQAVEAAIDRAAPDAERVEIVDPAALPQVIPLESLLDGGAR